MKLPLFFYYLTRYFYIILSGGYAKNISLKRRFTEGWEIVFIFGENLRNMFTVIGSMFLGVGVGYLLRNVKGIGKISSSISWTILLLLFLLGTSVGANPEIVNNLSSLGVEAFLLALAATIGSIIAGKIIYKFFFREEQEI